jgi:hypothetical protein
MKALLLLALISTSALADVSITNAEAKLLPKCQELSIADWPAGTKPQAIVLFRSKTGTLMVSYGDTKDLKTAKNTGFCQMENGKLDGGMTNSRDF